ncbi:uncharacterized protein LOC119443973 isoform X2 [Dermacentor silvarum]|uniref:uncharacterized protein LOC119443973 isoform X2 n=1 Tax=Dermacentor silvarum TaxID=543639 RepID=UPI0021016560|nr:uncharacterized protein LOC119443973 isoform X2 [Dermacentor silvarum]
MKYQVALALFVATCASLVASSTEVEVVGNGKCGRAFPLPPWRSSYRLKCTYLCRGWPIRYDNEPDGIHCGLLAALVKTHVCSGGKCVRAPSVESTTHEEFFTTLPPTSTDKQPTTEEPYTSEENTTYLSSTDD